MNSLAITIYCDTCAVSREFERSDGDASVEAMLAANGWAAARSIYGTTVQVMCPDCIQQLWAEQKVLAFGAQEEKRE